MNCRVIVLFFSVCFALSTIPAIAQETAPTSEALIQQAFTRGAIDRNQRAEYFAYTMFDPARLPSQFQSAKQEKYPDWMLDEIFLNWDSLDAPTRDILTGYGFQTPGTLARPTINLPSIAVTKHYRLHYSIIAGDTNAVSLADSNHNGTPDYIDAITATLEHVWYVEVDSLGFTPPIAHVNRAADSLFDVYIYKLPSGTYGSVTSDSLVGDNPLTPFVVETNAYSSYMKLRNNYSTFTDHSEIGNIQVTTSHEFFHGIKNGIDRYALSWMNEATAAWMEDVVYDSVDDNQQYLSSWFNHPEYPLDANNGADTLISYANHWYGSWIFFAYVAEHLGGSVTVRSIWDSVPNYPNKSGDYSFAEIGRALGVKGESFPQVFGDFAAANAILTLPPYSYSEGADDSAHTSLEYKAIFSDTLFRDTIYRHASRYYKVYPRYMQTAMVVNLTPLDAAAHFNGEVITRTGSVVQAIPFTDHYCLPLTPPPDKIWVVVMNTDSTGTADNYVLRILLNVRLQKTAAMRVTPSTPINYTLTAFNATDSNLTNVFLTDTLYPGSHVFNIGTGAYDDTIGGFSIITMNIPTLAAGASQTMTYSVMDSICGTVYNSTYALSAYNIPVVCGAAVQTNAIADSAHYAVTDLNGLYPVSGGGTLGADATAINNRGEITGESPAPPNATYPTYSPSHAFLWRNGVMKDLGTFDGPGLGPDSHGAAINNLSQVAGTAEVVVGTPPYISYYNHGFIGQGGGMTDVGALPTTFLPSSCLCYGINDKGQVVGNSTDSTITGQFSGFLYSPGGGMTRLNALPESSDSECYVYGMNNRGQAVGNSDSAGLSRAVMWDNGGAPQRLAMLSPGNYYESGASAINDNGQIVGWCDSLGPLAGVAYIHAVLWDHGAAIDLGSLNGYAQASSINNRGDIVGYCYPPGVQPPNGGNYSFYGTAFVLPHGGRMMSLDSLLTPTCAEGLNYATGINDSGQIIAYAWTYNYMYKESYLLTPISKSTGIVESSLPPSSVQDIIQNYPNPFREQTTLSYQIQNDSRVEIDIVNMLGETVEKVFTGVQTAGNYTLPIDGAQFSSGVYFCKITVNGTTTMHPIVSVR